MNRSGRAYGLAFAAEFALRIIYVCDIVVHGYGTVRTGLDAHRTAYAGVGAGLFCDGSLVMVDAVHKLPHSSRTFGPEFYDGLGTCTHTCSAGRALFLVDLRQTCGRIHVDGVELAGRDAVSATETAVGAARIAGIKGGFHLAGSVSVIYIDFRTCFASSVTTHHSHHGGFVLDRVAKNRGHFFHDLVSSYRTVVAVQIRSFHGRFGECAAARVSAASAIGSGHYFLNLVNPGIFLYLELFSNEVKDKRKHKTQQSDDCNSPNNC